MANGRKTLPKRPRFPRTPQRPRNQSYRLRIALHKNRERSQARREEG